MCSMYAFLCPFHDVICSGYKVHVQYILPGLVNAWLFGYALCEVCDF